MRGTALIGRDGLLSQVKAVWRRLAEGGQGPVAVTFTGEAGLGKTRMLREAVAAIDPPRLLVGTARADGAAPHDWFAAAAAGIERPDGTDERLWRVLRQEPVAEPLRLPDGAVLRSAVRTVRRLVGSGPALLAVDDLHWLDPESLALWSELAAAWDLPVMLLACGRGADEARHPEAVARTLSRLGATIDGLWAPLRPLTVEETGAMVGACTGRPVMDEDARAIRRRTGGVPFWIAELAGAGAIGEVPLPGHLAALVRVRLAGADEDAWRLARGAALLGERSELEVLGEVVGGEVVERGLPQLIAAGVQVREGGVVRFPHALMREAFAATALPEEERTLHRAALRAARERGDEAAIMRHAEAIGDTGSAVAAALRLSAARLDSFLADSALESAEAGLALEPDDAGLLDLAGRAATLVGDFAAARAHLERLASVSAGHRCIAYLRLAEIVWHQGRVGLQWRRLEEAEALAEPGSVEHARCLTGRAMALMRGEDYEEVLRVCDEALPLIERHGLTVQRRSVQISRATAQYYLGDPDGAEATLRGVWRDAETHGDVRKLARAVTNLFAIRMLELPEAEGRRLFDEGVEAVGDLGMAVWGGKINRSGADAAMRHGDLERAWELLSSRVADEPDPHERAVLAAKAGLLEVERGDFAEARRYLTESMSIVAGMDQGWVVTYPHLLAVGIAHRDGDRAAVARAMDAYRESVAPGQHRHRAERVLEVARLGAERGVEESAVVRFAGGCLGEVPGPGDRPAADLLWMTLRAKRGDWEGVLTLLDGAADGQDAVDRSRAYALAAQAHRRLGDGSAALEHALEARALLRRWRGWRLVQAEELVEVLEREAAAPAVALTRRESEVLELAADGRSNRQIAAALGISQRTVEVHMSRVLAKTGAAGRTEAVARFLSSKVMR